MGMFEAYVDSFACLSHSILNGAKLKILFHD
jgi:hypothetical protein